jgi:hypothetical protein
MRRREFITLLRRTLQNLTFAQIFAGTGRRAARHDQEGPGRTH